MDLTKAYRYRFSGDDRARKARVWQVLYRQVFDRWIGPEDVVLDLGAGFCEFINAARGRRRIAVDLNPEVRELAAPQVEVRIAPASDLAFLADREVDLVFSSNFLEHLADKQEVTRTVQEAFRVLREGGTLILMGPNVRLIPGAYWDFFDHHVPLSDRSMKELLLVTGFTMLDVQARFIPYTTRSAIPQAPWMVWLYLALRPVSSRIFGRQFLIVARKPVGGQPGQSSSERP